MSHSNIANFTNFLEKKVPRETQEDVLKHAKAKSKLAKEFIPKLTKTKQKQLETEFCALPSITAIDNAFRDYINANM